MTVTKETKKKIWMWTLVSILGFFILRLLSYEEPQLIHLALGWMVPAAPLLLVELYQGNQDAGSK
jgi:hypothetical protein